MAVIHRTTLTPSKLALIETLLPRRPWYRGQSPRLRKVGGFRLDDPAGAVGIEFVLVVDDSADGPVLYNVPLTYRGAPLLDGDRALVGTTEHGVLGRRWIYDGTADPVALGVVVELLSGRAVAQAQNHSDTPDPSVLVTPADILPSGIGLGAAVDSDTATEIPIGSAGAVLRFPRRPSGRPSGAPGSVAAPYELGGERRAAVEVVALLPRK
ncbi:1,4-alpha-glucan branching protein [Nocardia sp. NPDC051833]|uniref:maltokinase N-terminal cap-like domain-containing protein n=1 Tax=Nocardia sp. NPDC051833 TaxID=3155674 RepID=UPI0034324F42